MAVIPAEAGIQGREASKCGSMLARLDAPIAAIATAPGRGAVGIVRVSGESLAQVIEAVCGRALKPR